MAAGPEGLTDVAPVGVGQPDVEHQRAERRLRGEHVDRLGRAVRDDHVEVDRGQRLLDHATDLGVVLAQTDRDHV